MYIPRGTWQTRTVSHVPRLLTLRHCWAVAVNRGGHISEELGVSGGGGGSTHYL